MSGTTARGFLAAALIYGIVGLATGLAMAVSEDHTQRPTHAHIMVIGWISFFLFALFYDRYHDRVSPLWARAHFWVAQISTPVLFIALWLVYSGEESLAPLAAASAIAYASSFLLFAAAAWPMVRGSN